MSEPLSGEVPRCGAAHPEDFSTCDGPVDSVRVVDSNDDACFGCPRHAAVLLASLERGRVYPGSGSAIEVYRKAQTLKPFDFEAR